ncbi:MAG: hypothetical protein ABC585_05755 [Candidatus Methanosuratincola petrocarbonis]
MPGGLRDLVADVRRRISRVPDEGVRMALTCCYLLAARASEVVASASGSDTTTPYGPRGTDAWQDVYDHYGRKVEVAVFRLRTAKRGGLERYVGLPLDPVYEPLTRPVFEYFKSCGGGPCFPFTRQTLFLHASKAFRGLTYPIEKYRGVDRHEKGAGVHFLRHLRASELRWEYGIKGENLADYGGWSYRQFGMTATMARYQMMTWHGYFPLLLKPSPYAAACTA